VNSDGLDCTKNGGNINGKLLLGTVGESTNKFAYNVHQHSISFRSERFKIFKIAFVAFCQKKGIIHDRGWTRKYVNISHGKNSDSLGY